MAESENTESVASAQNGSKKDQGGKSNEQPPEPRLQTQRRARGGHVRIDTTVSQAHTAPHESPHSRKQPQRPHFSLAGTQGPPAHAPSYVDPRYFEQNPQYGQRTNKPLFSVAKPFPHLVRGQGGRQTRGVQDARRPQPSTNNVPRRPIREPGTEPVPQVKRISSQINDEYHASGRGGDGDADVRSHASHNTNAPRPHIYSMDPKTDSSQPARASQVSMVRYGTPKIEKEDPLEMYIFSQKDSEVAKEFQIPSDRHIQSPQNAAKHDFRLTRTPSSWSSDHSRNNAAEAARRKLSDVREALSSDTITEDQDTKSTTPLPRQSYHSKSSSNANPFDTDLESCRNSVFDGSLQDHSHYPEIEWGQGMVSGNTDNELEAFEYGEEEVPHNWWAPIRERLREPLAEGLATFIFVLIALSTNLSVLTSKDVAGNYQSSNWAGGLGVMVGVYVAGGISGGHLNPALSIILCIFRGFPPRKTLTYILAQCIGAFLAALVAFGIYKEAILILDEGVLNTGAENSGHAFLTGLSSWTSPVEGWANEFVATGILACAILALGDDQNSPPGAGMHALVVGLVISVLGMAFGYPTGPCLNPARDLGPRLAALVVGYGGKVFTMDCAWWIWGAWASTISGAIVGSFFYDALIFVGGESPVNYLGKKRKVEKNEERWKWLWHYGSRRAKMGHGL